VVVKVVEQGQLQVKHWTFEFDVVPQGATLQSHAVEVAAIFQKVTHRLPVVDALISIDAVVATTIMGLEMSKVPSGDDSEH